MQNAPPKAEANYVNFLHIDNRRYFYTTLRFKEYPARGGIFNALIPEEWWVFKDKKSFLSIPIEFG